MGEMAAGCPRPQIQAIAREMKMQDQWEEVTVAIPVDVGITPEQWRALIEAVSAAVPAIISLVTALIAVFTKLKEGVLMELVMAFLVGFCGASACVGLGKGMCPQGGCVVLRQAEAADVRVSVTAKVEAVEASATLVSERPGLFRGRRPIQRVIAFIHHRRHPG